MLDDQGLTLGFLLGSLGLIGLSVLMLRLRHRRRTTGWVPWNGLLFMAIVIAALALAHLLGVQSR